MAETLQDATPARTPLNRERVLRAAIALADEQGLTALTMRRLAQQLGVEAMSLYHHVPGKDRLLEGMLELVTEEMTVARPGGDWKAELRASALSAHEVLGRHPWAAGAISATARPIEARFRFMEGLLSTLRAAGLTPTQTDHAYHALDSHITGFTLWVASMRLDEIDLQQMARQVMRELPRSEYPGLIEHIEVHLAPRDPDDEGSFAFGLDLLLDGFERLFDGSPDREARTKKGKRKRRG
jgi:AcrR family transcriptional regulator